MYLGLTPGPAGTASALPALRGLGAEAAIPAQVNKSPSKWRKARTTAARLGPLGLLFQTQPGQSLGNYLIWKRDRKIDNV